MDSKDDVLLGSGSDDIFSDVGDDIFSDTGGDDSSSGDDIFSDAGSDDGSSGDDIFSDAGGDDSSSGGDDAPLSGLAMDDIPAAAIVDFDEMIQVDEPEELEDVNYDSEDLGSLAQYGLLKIKYGSDKIESYTRRINYIFGARQSLLRVGYFPLSEQRMNIPSADPENLVDRIETGNVEGLEQRSLEMDLQIYVRNLRMVYERANQLATTTESVTQHNSDAVKRMSELVVPEGAGSFFQLDVMNIIRYLDSTESKISANAILDELRNRHPEQISWFDMNTLVVLAYCENAISAYQETIMRVQSEAAAEKAKQLKNVRFILTDVNQLLAKAARMNKESKLHFIRQVIVRDDGCYVRCPVCGEETKLTGPMLRCITVQKKDDHGVFLVSLPEIIMCKCGVGQILTNVDLTKFELYLKSMEQNALKVLNDNAGIMSPIYPISQFSIAQKLCEIDQEITAKYGRQKDSNVNIFLFEKDTSVEPSAEVEADPSLAEEKPEVFDTFNVITNSEFRKAVKEFRERLRMMNTIEEEETISDDDEDDPALMLEMQSYRSVKLLDEDARLSYKLMAALVAVSISEDYQTLKNQALYSLISVFHENALFMEVMDGNNLWDCKMTEFSIQQLTKKKVFDSAALHDLMIYYNALFDDKILTTEELTDAKVTEVVAKLNNSLESLEEKFRVLSESKQRLIKAIRESQDALAFTKIVKVTSVNLSTLESIITSSEIAELFDEITDRMIITNFSDKFYDAFIMMSRTQATTLKGFDNAVDTNTAIAACDKFIKSKVADDIRGHVAMQPVAFEYFSLATDISANTWEPCYKLDSYVHTCNVFGVLSIINDLDNVDSRQISTEYSLVFEESLKRIHEFADKMQHVKSMNQNIFYLTDVGFTHEEIDDYVGSIDFHFNRYMLLREENESLDSYLARLRKAINEGMFRDKPHKDYYNVLEPYVYDLFILCAGGYFYSFESNKFILSAFIISLINTYVKYVPQKLTLNKFGFSDELFNLVRTNLYKVEYRPDHGRIAHQLLDTNYSTDLASIFSEWSSKYNECIIHSTDSLQNFNKFFSITDVIADCIDTIQDKVNTNAPLTISKDGKVVTLENYDAAEMLEEFRAAASYYGIEVNL